MIRPIYVIIFIFVYMISLFIVAFVVERKYMKGKNLANNAVIYALALAIYCTTWTFYGNVGLAATNGLLYLGVYVGPTLTIIFWWQLLRKMIRIKNENRLTSLADFLSARYNKSQAVAAIATIIALIGIMPYIALQLKAIITSFAQITSSGILETSMRYYVDFSIVGLMIIFTIIFGFWRWDMSERHPGMVMVVAIQSVIKLFAFLSAGIFVVYFLFNGFGDLFGKFQSSPPLVANWQSGSPSYSLWITYTILSMAAIMLLPRQFHMSVIENSNEKHIRTAMWILPLYFILITMFSLPIAIAGIIYGYDISLADFFILLLPIRNGAPILSLLVFMGGFSAAVSMIMISTMTMTTMATNHLVVPMIGKFKKLQFLLKYILPIRWIVVVMIIFSGYWFKLKLGASYILVKMGMISFAAALQFAPAMLGGLFWKKGNKTGAIWGLTSGFVVWGYVSLLPAFIKSGLLPMTILTNGPFNIAFLRPEQLFGINIFEPLTLTVILTMFFNVGGYVLGSTLTNRNEEEKKIANDFIDVFVQVKEINRQEEMIENIDMNLKKDISISLLSSYLSKEKAGKLVESVLKKVGLNHKKSMSVIDLAKFNGEIEKELSGIIGSASAREIFRNSKLITEDESRNLSGFYGKLIADLKLSPTELNQKIDYYQEREKLYKKQSNELGNQVRAKTNELENALTNLRLEKKELEKQRLASLNILEDVHESQLELERINDSLKKRHAELEALKSLSDQLSGILDLDEAVATFIALIREVLSFTSITFLVLNPVEEGGFLYLTHLNEEVGEGYLVDIKNTLLGYVNNLKISEFKEKTIKILNSINPQILGRRLNNDIKIKLLSQKYFPLKIGDDILGFVYFTLKEEGLEKEEGLTDAMIVNFTLFVTRLQTLILSQHSRTESLINSINDGVIMFNNDKHIILMNPKVLTYTGLQKEGFIFDEFFNIFSSVSIEKFVDAALESGELSHIKDVKLINYFFEILITPVKDNQGIIVGGAIIIHDITYLKEIDRMKTEFVSVASHQLRTPLTAIKLFTEMLMRGDVGKLATEQKDYLGNIFQSTERMVSLVNDLLSLSRLESGHLKIETKKVNLIEFISNLINDVSPIADAKKIELDFKHPKEMNEVEIDPNLLQQVINNLLANAIRYTHKENLKVEVKIEKKGNDYIVSFKDRGIGIPKEVQANIFNKFFRADNAIKAETEGTGLGLYVSKMIVESSGGKIWFKSDENSGTTFYFTIPINRKLKNANFFVETKKI